MSKITITLSKEEENQLEETFKFYMRALDLDVTSKNRDILMTMFIKEVIAEGCRAIEDETEELFEEELDKIFSEEFKQK